MTPVRYSILLGLFSAMMVTSQTPPIAPSVEHREVRHGATVIDDYFWLREKSNPKVTQYMEAENAYTAAMTKDLQPFSDALYKEMLGRIKQTDLSVPRRATATCTIRAPRRANSTPSSAAAKEPWRRPRRCCSTSTSWARTRSSSVSAASW